MVKRMTSAQRYKTMASIRSKWTNPEKVVHNYLKGKKVRHKMHPKIMGNPDVYIGKRNVLFIDGCFWHGCPRCFRLPLRNKSYWLAKISRNINRDRRVTRTLRLNGYRVVRIKEHDLKAPSLAISDALSKLRFE